MIKRRKKKDTDFHTHIRGDDQKLIDSVSEERIYMMTDRVKTLSKILAMPSLR